MVKISINKKECIGCSFCTDCAPEIFEIDEQDFKCKIKQDGKLVNSMSVNLSAEQLKQVKEAKDGCAVQAIELEE
ncbi:MAG: ferredoxin [Candidatus Zambryskibacteria bacterium]